jgi:5'-phosphate synthase pdxT subunit
VGGSTRPPDSTPTEGRPHIGVLALQGAFREHAQMLRGLGAAVSEVRLPSQLAGLDGLVIPGGESTTMGLLMEQYGLMAPLRSYVEEHPVFGTCAGLIMLASRTTDDEQPLLGVMDITVRRNAFGRQTRSFEAPVDLRLGGTAGGAAGAPPEGDAPGATARELGDAAQAGGATFRGIFIRAPWVEEMGPAVEAIAHCDGHVVGVREKNMIGVAFHPELGDDTRLHAYFLDLVGATR